MTTELGDDIRRSLAGLADPQLAGPMAAYMKVAENGGLPFLGIRRPVVRQAARGAAKEFPDDQRLAAAVDLWEHAEFREQRYAAQDLLGMRWAADRLDLLDLHREMVLTGAWWDHVDEVAHRIADLVRSHPEVMADVLHTWSADENLWIRRVAIIGQLGLREQVDLDLLARVVETNSADPEFFIRKAIGWALRDAGRTYPDWVRAFVASHDLSPLSRREALKHLR
ncbi:MAG: DNA alkylation repair protein [Propionibacteriales bacterium]|nr:DNA alkylation repair protein [Propionibacteriales bacterium]